MKIDILTLFPEFFISPLQESILKRAQEKEICEINTINIRDYAEDKHKKVDDYPYGGGSGMLMKADIISRAINACKNENTRVVLMSPQGQILKQKKIIEMVEHEKIVIICGHYEGIDERAMKLVDEEISIGDFILTGGEIPALALIDAIVRMLPGVLGDKHSTTEESFMEGLLEYPQYTRPAEIDGALVPEVLLSGHHENIRKWRKKQSLVRTFLKRPDLLLMKDFDQEEKEFLEEILFKKGEHLN